MHFCVMEKSRPQKICCFFNYNPHYRLPIYKEMSEKLDCDFYFGDSVFERIEPFDPGKLKGFQHLLKAHKAGNYIWHSGISSLFRKEYTHYIITATPVILSCWPVILYAKLTGKKVLCWSHGLNREVTKPFWKLYDRILFGSMDGILLYNRHNLQYMEKLGCDPDRIRIIHNSLDSDRQTALFQAMEAGADGSAGTMDIYSRHFGNDDPVIIYIGRIQKRKKLELLVEAVRMLNSEESGHGVNLAIVGDGSDGGEIARLVANYELEDRVWFYGPSYDEKTNAELLYHAAACVCPAAVGLTAIHALSYGTPVITNDNLRTQMPEFEAITEGVTGSFFREDDAADLCARIKHWTSQSPTQRAECRKSARATIEKDWNVRYQMDIIRLALDLDAR